MKQIEFQVAKRFNPTNEMVSELKLIECLKSERFRLLVEPIRSKVNDGDVDSANELKKLLPAIIVSGRFKETRTIDSLLQYSQIICLDLDKLAFERVAAIKEKIINSEYTYIAFLSPSGRGIKIFVKVSSEACKHKVAYKQVVDYYSKLLSEKFDEQTSDLTRLTFLSYDPDVYHYPDSKVFQVTAIVENEKIPLRIAPDQYDYRAVYEHAYQYTENKQKYEGGNRNNFLYLLSCNCNRFGLPKDVLLDCLDWCDLTGTEIERTVNSGYKHSEEFNTWKPKVKQNDVLVQAVTSKYEDVAGYTAVIPAEVKQNLPDFMAQLISGYNERQSDMALTALLSLLSGMMNTTKGVFNNSITYPALCSMITAPSGSGKSVTGGMQRLFLPLHHKLLKSYEQQNGLFLPDNTTTPALIKKLADNDGKGVLFSTDMGFLGHALKHDVAGLQAIFRAAHSGEMLTNGRSAKNQAVTVTAPKLAACLCGTPPEFKHLFSSSEDGLISRFIHYCFVPDKEWQDIKITSLADYKQNEEHAANLVMSLYNYVFPKAFEFSLSEEQLLALNDWLSIETASAQERGSCSAINPIIKRMGLVVFKLSMIFATLRAWESNRQEVQLSINADDFDVVMQLSRVYFQHAASIVNYVTEDAANGLDAQLRKFFDALPEGTVKRNKVIEIAQEKGIQVSPRTIDNWLKKLCELNFLGKAYNSYTKVSERTGLGRAA